MLCFLLFRASCWRTLIAMVEILFSELCWFSGMLGEYVIFLHVFPLLKIIVEKNLTTMYINLLQ